MAQDPSSAFGITHPSMLGEEQNKKRPRGSHWLQSTVLEKKSMNVQNGITVCETLVLY